MGESAGVAPVFFSPREWTALRAVVDCILPADERSGGATDAGVPEALDTQMARAAASEQAFMRDGLRWLDAHSMRRFGAPFAAAGAHAQAQLLDLVAWPERAPPEARGGARFFGWLRDQTATAFWLSPTGICDLGLVDPPSAGGPFEGCPRTALRQLGVSASTQAS